jgi:hypothetical protein
LPLISIFKRKRNGLPRSERITPGRTWRSLGPIGAPGGQPGAVVRIAGDFQSSKYTSMPFSSAGLVSPFRNIDTGRCAGRYLLLLLLLLLLLQRPSPSALPSVLPPFVPLRARGLASIRPLRD